MQEASDGLTPSRRSLDVQDYVDIVRRHKGWIIGPAFAGLVASVVTACLWPSAYVSEAVIRVQMPLVSERYVPTNSSMDLTDRINGMIPEVLKQDSLHRIIQRTRIYEKEQQREPMLDIVTRMQKHIDIGRVVSIQASGARAPVPAFKVSFEYPDRQKAFEVTTELVGEFLKQDASTRFKRSSTTTTFLTEQTKAAKGELDDIESRLTDFKTKNTGRLPDQLQTNLQALRALEAQMSSANQTINRIEQEQLLLRSQDRIYRDQVDSMVSPAEQLSTTSKSERLAQTERDILQFETSLAAARERYTSAHPDVRTLESQLALLKKTREALLKQEQKPEQKKPEQPQSLSPAEARIKRQVEMNLGTIHAQIEAKDLELQERQKEQKRLQAAMNAYNSKIETSPALEQEFARLSRDYAFAKARYEELTAKRTQSEAATELERQSSGELLEILQDPTKPQTPSKPNRPFIVSVGTAFGLLLGLILASGREVKDSSLKNLKDARAYTRLPVLGSIPLLENDIVMRRKRRLVWLAWSAACLLGVIAMSASFIYYYTATRM